MSEQPYEREISTCRATQSTERLAEALAPNKLHFTSVHYEVIEGNYTTYPTER